MFPKEPIVNKTFIQNWWVSEKSMVRFGQLTNQEYSKELESKTQIKITLNNINKMTFFVSSFAFYDAWLHPLKLE